MDLEVLVPNHGIGKVSVAASPNDTVLEIKRKVSEATGIEMTAIKLHTRRADDLDKNDGMRRVQGFCNRARGMRQDFFSSPRSGRGSRSCERSCVNVQHHPREALENDNALRNYRLVFRDGLVACHCKTFKIHFEAAKDNGFYCLEVRNEDTIRDIRNRLARKFGFLKCQMVLFFNGRSLHDKDRTVWSWNMPHNSTISVGFM